MHHDSCIAVLSVGLHQWDLYSVISQNIPNIVRGGLILDDCHDLGL